MGVLDTSLTYPLEIHCHTLALSMNFNRVEYNNLFAPAIFGNNATFS